MTMPQYMDIADLDEDKRIQMIGHRAMDHREVVAFIVDSGPDYPGKADRYISKLKERFPGIMVIARGMGPVANTEWVKVGPSGGDA